MLKKDIIEATEEAIKNMKIEEFFSMFFKEKKEMK